MCYDVYFLQKIYNRIIYLFYILYVKPFLRTIIIFSIYILKTEKYLLKFNLDYLLNNKQEERFSFEKKNWYRYRTLLKRYKKFNYLRLWSL